MDEKHLCELCGEPMPEGEEMFKYHGYSCECPRQSLELLFGEDTELYSLWGEIANEVYTKTNESDAELLMNKIEKLLRLVSHR